MQIVGILNFSSLRDDFLIFKFHKNEKFAIFIISETVMIYYYILQLQGENIFIGGIELLLMHSSMIIISLKIQHLKENTNLNEFEFKKKKKKYLFIDENELIFLEIVIIHLEND